MSFRGELLDRGYKTIRPALFRHDPEYIHDWTISSLRAVCSNLLGRSALQTLTAMSAEPRTVAGITFPNPVGLAAGMDKNGTAVRAWGPLGFGFAELGTVTCQQRDGNPKPRLWRLPESESVINYMGLNNHGAERLAEVLRRHGVARGNNAVGIPLGISIGSVAATTEETVKDYEDMVNALGPLADYLAINVSCPNVSNAADMHSPSRVRELAGLVAVRSQQLAAELDLATPTPIFLKVSPDLTNDELEQTLEAITAEKLAGVIACNTTVQGRQEHYPEYRNGGLSGTLLHGRTREVVKFIRQRDQSLPIIACGGVSSSQNAVELIDSGADLVQVLTGLIYHGPALVHGIKECLQRR